MPQEWHIRDYGKYLSVVRVEDGIGAVRYTDVPPGAKDALTYFALKCTELQAQLDAEIAAHGKTRRELVQKANRVLRSGIALLASNDRLQERIAELEGHFPLVAEGDLVGG